MLINIDNVEFNEREHTYWLNGRQLYGVTGAIGQLLGKSYPEGVASIDAMRSYGSQVHKEVETWIDGGADFSKTDGMTDGAKWVVSRLADWRETFPDMRLESEVRVSDFLATASNVDIVLHTGRGTVCLFDIKTGDFDRNYCSLQLNAYRRMYEGCYHRKVLDMQVLCVKERRYFRIYDYDRMDGRLDALFRLNAEKRG